MNNKRETTRAVFELGKDEMVPDWVQQVAAETGVNFSGLERRMLEKRNLSGYVERYGIDEAVRYLGWTGIPQDMLMELRMGIDSSSSLDNGKHDTDVPSRFIVMAGTLGSGKSTVAGLLQKSGEEIELHAELYPEQWLGNPFLVPFNNLLPVWFNRINGDGDGQLSVSGGDELMRLQHGSQMWFLVSKMNSYLQAANYLMRNINAYAIVEPLKCEDWVYNRTQIELL